MDVEKENGWCNGCGEWMCKKEKSKKKIYERIKLLFEMRKTTERAKILLGRGRHRELVKFETAIRFLGENVT